jgi:hypothetical protein
MNKTTVRLLIGKDIILAPKEKLHTYRNRLNGEIVYSSSLYNAKYIDGVEFIQVFSKPQNPTLRKVNLMKKDNLERIAV